MIIHYRLIVTINRQQFFLDHSASSERYRLFLRFILKSFVIIDIDKLIISRFVSYTLSHISPATPKSPRHRCTMSGAAVSLLVAHRHVGPWDNLVLLIQVVG